MADIEFEVPGAPIPKGRPRASFKTGIIYTPRKTADYESSVKCQAMKAMWGRSVLRKSEPLRVEIIFNIQAPKRYLNKTGLKCNIYPVVKPDLDNFIKSVLDGMNGIVFEDDSQIVEIKASKKYVANGPMAIVKVEKYA